MKSELMQKWALPPKRLRLLIILVLVLGIFFRFAHFEQRAFTSDEVRSLLLTSGYTSQELIEQVFNGDVVSVADLQRYQQPNSQKNLVDAIKSLMVDNFPHSPLYFVGLRYWIQCFGNSYMSTQSLSGLISLLTLPAVYWLCLE
jgi:uncharacterized membrane protein